MFFRLTWREFAELRLERPFDAFAVTPYLFLCTDQDPRKKFLRKYFFVRIRRSEVHV